MHRNEFEDRMKVIIGGLLILGVILGWIIY